MEKDYSPGKKCTQKGTEKREKINVPQLTGRMRHVRRSWACVAVLNPHESSVSVCDGHGWPGAFLPNADPSLILARRRYALSPAAEAVSGAVKGRKWLLRSELCPAAARGGPARHRRPLTALLLEVQSAKSEEGERGGRGQLGGSGGEPSPWEATGCRGGSTVAVCLGQGGLQESQ